MIQQQCDAIALKSLKSSWDIFLRLHKLKLYPSSIMFLRGFEIFFYIFKYNAKEMNFDFNNYFRRISKIEINAKFNRIILNCIFSRKNSLVFKPTRKLIPLHFNSTTCNALVFKFH